MAILIFVFKIELHKRWWNDRKSLTVADPIQMVHKRNPTMFDGLPAGRPVRCETGILGLPRQKWRIHRDSQPYKYLS